MKNILKKAFLAASVTVVLIPAVSCTTSGTSGIRLLVGTYTANSSSSGVYLFNLDTRTLQAELLDTAAAGNPSFVIARDGKAYSVSEFSDGTQGVLSYSLKDNTTDVSGFQGGCGEDPCNLLIAGNFLLSSDYSGGTLSIFPLEENGGITPMVGQFNPRILTPDAPEWHIHCAALSPDGKYVFVTDLGADAVYSCRVEDLPRPEFSVAFRFEAGMHPGPRHLVFSPDGKYGLTCKTLCLSKWKSMYLWGEF